MKTNGPASVQDEADDDVEAGPELPPDDEEEGAGDEEGRFFGGGISSDTAEILNYVDTQQKDDGTVRSKHWGSGELLSEILRARRKLTRLGSGN